MKLDITKSGHQDPWIIFAVEMDKEFFERHRKTIPEDPYEVWDQSEVMFFCLAFTLGAARFNFRAKNIKEFTRRETQYIDFLEQAANGGENMDFADLFHRRFPEYYNLLGKGTNSFFRAISGSVFKPACKVFVENACKRYVFSYNTLVNIISPWVCDKGKELDRKYCV